MEPLLGDEEEQPGDRGVDDETRELLHEQYKNLYWTRLLVIENFE